MKRLNRKFITGMSAMLIALMVLVFGMVGCEQPTGPENQQGSEQPAAEESPGTTYVGATEDGTPVELTIEDGTYAVTVDGEEVSSGTVTEAADGAWTLQPEDGEAFTATTGEDGLTIKGPITDELDGEDLRELYPVVPPADVEADYSVSLSVAALHVFPSANAGYKAQTAKTIAVTNTGNKATGKLTLEVSNAVPAGGFTLNKETIASIAAGKKAAFTVKPALDLEAGVYNARITVSGGNGISAGFNVRFTVTEADEPDEPEEPVDPPEEPVYGIELDAEGDYTFPEAVEGYEAREPITVTITNTGNQETGELTLKVSNGDFTLSKSKIDNIAVDGEDSFTVVPAGGLGKGSYTATVTVSGENDISAEFEVSFAVNVAPVYGITLSETETLIFDDAILGYDARPERTITITNIGNSPTGNLRATLDGADSGSFTRTPPVPNDIAENGGTAAFYVRANLGLDVGTYTATVTVSGENVASASFDVRFTVKPVPTHGISLSSDDTAIGASYTHQFGTVTLPNYTLPAALAVTVANSGNQPTGGLAIGVTGADFTLSKTAIDSLAVDGTASFTVTPNANLTVAKIYEATVTVSGGNGISASFGVSFEVKPVPVYGISLDVSGTHTFPDAILGYGVQAEVPVTVSNTGNQPTGVLAIGLTGTGSGSFTLDKQTITDIAAGSSGSFTVVPKTGLSEGTHTATVSVTGANGIFASFNVSFEVTASYGITLDVEGEYPFPGAILGYPAQPAKTINIGNTGNQPTGNLTLNVSTTDFVLDPPTTVASIAVGTTGSFTVTPALGLAAGTHTAIVTVSGGSNIEEQSFSVSFEVTATYGVTLSRNGASIGADYTHPFGTVTLPNYTLPAALSVTVTNTGNQPTGALTVSLGGTNSGSFTVTQPNPSSIAVGTAGSFTVTPNTNLAAGPHSATVTVGGDNGISAAFGVSFEVTYSSYWTLADGTVVRFGVADLSALCSDSGADAEITVNGQSIAKNTITKVVIGGPEFAGITALPAYFCMNFSNLTELDLSGLTGLTSIGEGFMADCHAFNDTLTLPSTITDIGGYFMQNCKSFNKSITLPEGLTSIAKYFLSLCPAFNQDLVIPEGVTSIATDFLWGSTAFNSELTLPSTLTSIGYQFMDTCKAFNQPLAIPESVTSIGHTFLYNCFAFNQPLTIPESVTSIGYAFLYNCDSLVSTVTLNCPVTAFYTTGADGYSFAAVNAAAECYVTGIPIAGPSAAAIMARFPSGPGAMYGVPHYRMLIAASSN